MRRSTSSILTLTGWLLAGAIAVAGDWPQFRGPTGQGIADSDAAAVPLTWSESENVRWKVAVDGLGWSSPSIVGGMVYLTTSVPVTPPEEKPADELPAAEGDAPAEAPADPVDTRLLPQTLEALCLDAETGAEVWRVRLFDQPGSVQIHGKNSHASPTPLVADGKVYVHFGPHGTACLTTDGNVVWKNEEIEYAPNHGTGASPVLSGDVLVIPCDGLDLQFVLGLDKSTGVLRWKQERKADVEKGFSFSTPLLIDVSGRELAVSPGSGAVVAYDPATGDEVWRVRYDDGFSVVPRPVFAHGLVYVCTGYGKPWLLAIDPSGAGDVTDTHIKWKTDRAAPNSPSVIVVGDELFMVSDQGVASCLDAVTGEKHWQERLGGNFSASPTYIDGRIYFQDENGTAIVVAAGREFVELGRSSWGDGVRTFASYAVADGALFIRSETHVYRVEAEVRQTGG
ncbi:MAG: PQQ-binding-like beta-propeller repeat protein [Planctomycetaceae bacterium]|nr:PQQ-binding-like beta-propeller repeat protein [Planctomycetaceae bacterium]